MACLHLNPPRASGWGLSTRHYRVTHCIVHRWGPGPNCPVECRGHCAVIFGYVAGGFGLWPLQVHAPGGVAPLAPHISSNLGVVKTLINFCRKYGDTSGLVHRFGCHWFSFMRAKCCSANCGSDSVTQPLDSRLQA
jgi:hypothetical protein